MIKLIRTIVSLFVLFAILFVIPPAVLAQTDISSSSNLFTDEELLFIEQYKEVYVIGAPNAAPYEYYTNGEYIGTMPLLFGRISSLTGLKFVYLPPTLYSYDRVELAENKQAEIISVIIDGDDVLNHHGYTLSEACFANREGNVAFAYTNLAPTELISIINKALDSITQNERIEISLSAAAWFARIDYPLWQYVVFILGWALFALFFVLFLVRRKQKRVLIKTNKVTDSLTGIGNLEYLREKFSELGSIKQLPLYAMIYLRTNVEHIREYYGDAEADECLRNIASELASKCYDGDFVARVGDVSFVLLCVADTQEIVREKIEPVMEQIKAYPERVARDYRLLPRAGATFVGKDRYDADIVIFEARQAYRYACEEDFELTFCTKKLMQKIATDQGINSNIRAMPDLEEFVLYALPVIEVSSKRIVGADVVVRWMHPEKGLITPDAFISLMEETGQIMSLNYHIFNKICRWQHHRKTNNLDKLVISCRFSLSNFKDTEFASRISAIMEKYGIGMGEIEFSINETLLRQGGEVLLNNLQLARDRGIIITLDNFGSTNSSICALMDYNVDRIKIGHLLMQRPFDKESVIILSTIVGLGHYLGKSVICAGIETEEQKQIAEKISSDFVQGYYYYMPLPCDRFDEIDVRLT